MIKREQNSNRASTITPKIWTRTARTLTASIATIAMLGAFAPSVYADTLSDAATSTTASTAESATKNATSNAQNTSDATGDTTTSQPTEAEIAAAKKKVTDAKQTVTDKQTALDDAKKELDEAKKAQQEDQASKSAQGLFQSVLDSPTATDEQKKDAQAALDTLLGKTEKPSWYDQLVQLKKDGGPDSIASLQESFGYYEAINGVRAQNNQNTLNVSLETLAQSIVNSFYSATKTDHAGTYSGWENLAWGPFGAYTGGTTEETLNGAMTGWYSDERSTFNLAVATGNYNGSAVDSSFLRDNRYNAYSIAVKYPALYQATGHYLNFIASSLSSMGITLNHNTNFSSEVIWRGSANAGTISVADFKTLVNNYVSGNAAAARVEAAQKKVNEAQKALDDAKKALEDAQSAYNTLMGITPVYRLFNPNAGTHHYTTQVSERDWLVSQGWNYENISFNASVRNDANSNVKPVYREYNPNNGLHNWTMSKGEHDYLVQLGWHDEGIGWYTNMSGNVLVWRLYNPNTGEHMYTTNLYEYEVNGNRGWNQENIAWHGLADAE